MSHSFELHPDPMMRQSNRLLDAVEESKSEHSAHHGVLESAVPQMWGQTQGALEAAHAALADQTRVLHKHLAEHGVGMQEFTGQVVAMDDLNADSYGQG
ncbi:MULTISPECIES: hypothetical protein [Mycobacteroides]|nr:hypothetical protein [Mycobacteroides abscessus]QRJ69321.1 WXG motif protein [Mycobacterium phage phiT45-1]ANO20653.1 hypothetical protein BAB78_20445 [Mycobacteroides abscessus]MDM3922050.1 hypothetical protein [Mycobacteroides abscessus]MDO2967763.1 hypothetical protein [Mycobacteroides abscessus subsp. abscessus]MDO3178336.1 hypothetical protein [Mycobacteroides abscessus subsp. abscessus]